MSVALSDLNFAIYVLGAGFSKAAGLPLASELWPEILKRGLQLDGRGKKFRRDLDQYIEYRKRSFGEHFEYETVEFERFLGYLDIEHHLGLRGGEQWSSQGNEGQIVVKTLIGQILTERTPSPKHIPDLYLEFASKLKPEDVVFTFNYDILLERALERVGTKYRLFANRYEDLHPDGGGILDSRDDEVLLFKLHGSVDWFDKRPHLMIQDAYRRQGADPASARHPIFNPARYPYTLRRIVDGPRSSDDPFREVHRVHEVERLYMDYPWFHIAPSLISPSTEKIVYTDKQDDFLRGFKYGGGANFKMAIIGYSLPAHDSYAHQILYHLVTNYQGTWAERNFPDRKKSPLVVVDFLPDTGRVVQFKERYRFVDWDTAILYGEGFGKHALEHL